MCNVESFITTQRGARASEQRDGRERATRRRGVCAEQRRTHIVRVEIELFFRGWMCRVALKTMKSDFLRSEPLKVFLYVCV